MRINKGIDVLDGSWHLIPSLLIEVCDYGLGSKWFVIDLLFWKWSLYIEFQL